MHFPFETSVVGVSWHQEMITRIAEGDEVVIIAEPDNAYDRNALSVRVAGQHVGHLPRRLAQLLAREGLGRLEGTVSWKGGAPTTGVRVMVTGGGPAESSEAPRTPSDPRSGHLVRVRASGRALGTLIDHDRVLGRIVVDGPNGPVEYSDGLVEVDETAALVSA